MSILKTNRIENLTTTDGGINIDNSGRIGIGTSAQSDANSNADDLVIKATGSGAGITIFSDTNNFGNIYFGDDSSAAHRGRVRYDHTNDALTFSTSASERCRILSGGGLTFNGDTATTNALNDYEEGTWTPTMGFATSYGTRSGQYVKVGKTVHLHFSVQVTAFSTGTGSTRITGLPFNIDEVSGCWAACINAAATTRDWRIGPWTAGPYGMAVWMENGQGSASSVGIRMSENTFSDYSSLTGSLGTSFTMRGGMTYISTT